MILGIILTVVGFVLFLTGGILTNDEPGIQKPHAILMGIGLISLVIGGILLFKLLTAGTSF